MWAAFKLIPISVKIAIAFAIAAALAALMYVSYQRGLNVSKVEIEKYRTKVTQLQADVNKAEGQADVRVVTEYKDRIQVVTNTITKTRDVIREVVPEQFTFSKGWVYGYNESIAGRTPNRQLAANAESSGVTDREGLAHINENNGICLANNQQLVSLQQVITEREAARAEILK